MYQLMPLFYMKRVPLSLDNLRSGPFYVKRNNGLQTARYDLLLKRYDRIV
ncbi:hypothetical protein B4122_0432 [Bacillus subtilis]|uniref:Uncharacterized protein n=1 Tax=Bacillus subtilis TaxID=1423 RepID=A0AAP1HBV4_BACIU|nr:hypothetical protein B4122_0432 [Bacillus subtilis]